ncbi:DUF2306 domain-containing protein [Paenibacillus sacheonensis]|uniref:DUF2306 domain-containing protein n=2 Tax=Paenibacillus sacheonensis TaxID=742054 RepID=A0A7X5C1Y5_9BACL|nr:putative membrane protein [Paenibacillus sacheonensis]NBC70695.1 DUF2306 domain-containing protein [Paenibacillus sacheonensis]
MGMKRSWWLLVIVSLGIMIGFSAPYLTFDSANSRVDTAPGSLQFPVLVTHILFAFAALVTGFTQFMERVRTQRPKLHRNLGRIYVVSVMISALLALPLTGYMDDFSKAVGFIALALIWLFTTWRGYRSAVNRDFTAHRRWMIRSFGITLVAVSGRLLVPVLLLTYGVLHGFSLPEGREGMVDAVLNVNIWAGLIVNFMLVEWVFLKPKR